MNMHHDYEIIQDTIDNINYETWQGSIDNTLAIIQDIV